MSREYNNQQLQMSMNIIAKLMATAVKNKRMHFCLVGFTFCEHGTPDFIQACATFGNDPEGLVDVAVMLTNLAEQGGYHIDEEATELAKSPPDEGKPH